MTVWHIKLVRVCETVDGISRMVIENLNLWPWS